ncbi:MAG: rod shape-determining protein MreC [Elusimicrobia bacterium RIFCSPLOWO2_01_FULL_59_12]|nr:MAG: rod shape-determining protein MreC [Elusimicrobia bacterium RIFCSPLOWO2_01_FULL_59_12]
MHWELYERQRATLVLIGVVFLSVLLLAFQRSAVVQHIKSFFVACTFPSQRLFSQLSAPVTPSSPAAPAIPSAPVSEELGALPDAAADWRAEKFRALKVLADENARLNALLGLKRERWPRLVAARVVSRDPQRWFQEILLDKGQEDGLQVDDPVIAPVGNYEALVGRIVEAGARTSRVMLVHDSLSAVAATVSGASADDGVVEGSNSQDLYLRYLSRESQVKIGDSVATSGLGRQFPAGVPIGWVRDIQLDDRQLFLQARLNPALAASPLRIVGVLVRRD